MGFSKSFNGTIKEEIELFRQLYKIANINCKDKSTVNGAALVYNNDFKNSVCFWNQLIVDYGKECNDKILDDRDLKLDKIQHAERNLIYSIVNSNKPELKNFKKSSLYITWIPCLECSKTIIGVGIKNIIVHEHKHTWERKDWMPIMDKSMELLNEANVSLKFFTKKLGVKTRFNKKDIIV